jgi:hypothetical protein
MALVITLSLIVLVTVAAMAFFARATSNRIVESSRTNAILANQLAQTAQAHIVNQFWSEMSSNAVNRGTSTNVIYQVTSATGMVPRRLLAQPAMTNDTNFASLVRQSVASADPSASTDGTATASQNGRVVGANRWNAPVLNFGAGFTSANQLPDWIYVNRDGTTTATPTTSAIGRFAYNVYGTGGLLDANVAGNKGLTAAELQTAKGTLAGADLTTLGLTQTAVDALVDFRNPQSSASPSSYTNYLAGAVTVGFLKTVVLNGAGGGETTNNFFTSRQDLLRYARTQNTALTNALPYLVHSSRSATAPSWAPVTPVGSTIDYAATANTAGATNRFLPNVTVQATFTRRDGTQAVVGEPLVKTRFPLIRLAWIAKDGPVAPGNAATIQRNFGLAWDNSTKCWNYVGHSGSAVQSSIKTLDVVAGEDREPNFFELLKVGVLSGSLGQGPVDDLGSIGANWNPAYSRSSGQNNTRLPRLSDYQIIQIGVNLIDQSDGDDIPTAIRFDTTLPAPFYGVENLPYISKVFTRIFRPSAGYDMTGFPQTSFRSYLRGWLCFELWNPHGNVSAGGYPMRIVPTAGTMQIMTRNRKNAGNSAIPATSPYANLPSTSYRLTAPALSSGAISFTSSAAFGNSAVLTTTAGSATSAAAQNVYNDAGLNWVGFYLGDLNEPDSSLAGTLAGILPSTINDVVATGKFEVAAYASTDLTFEVQIDAGGGDWRTVQRIHGVNHQSNFQSFRYYEFQNLTFTDRTRNTVTVGSNPLAFSDPRTQRFGLGVMFATYATLATSTPWENITLRGGSAINFRGRFLRSTGEVQPFWAPNTSGSWDASEPSHQLAALCENISNALPSAWVRDRDGILRVGDGRFATPAGFDALGAGSSAQAARPVILNRPFRHVGEMGCAFRDQPWKTLDFFSDNSADSGLLDCFSVVDEPSVVAGKIHLNSAGPDVLHSILSGIERNVVNSNAALPTTEAQALAVELHTAVSTNALLNTSDLVSRMASLTFGGGADGAVKTRREVLVRALGDVGQVRTWNLLVDVVAQAGRTTSTNFLVEGESRQWMHVALDRVTGQVVNQQTEIVNE